VVEHTQRMLVADWS